MEAGVDLQVDNDNLVHLVPVGIYSEEKLEAGRAFAAALGLSPADEEEMFQAVESIAMWAAVRSSSK